MKRKTNWDTVFNVSIGIFLLLVVIIITIFDNTPSETSDQRFDRQQQERFQHEREQQDVQEYLQQRELNNKIKSGYYN